MHQGRSLDCAARALILQEMAGNTPEFAIDPGGEPFQGRRVTIRPGPEKTRGFGCLGSQPPKL